MIIDQVLNPPMAGGVADSKDYHTEGVSIPKNFVITCGKIVSVNGGKITPFNGSSYYAVVTDDVLNYGVGNATDEGTMSISKKGVRYLITTGTDMLGGDLVLAESDGSVKKGGATDSAIAIGKAFGFSFNITDKDGATVKLTPVEFNFDMIKAIVGVAQPEVQSKAVNKQEPTNTRNKTNEGV